jgi:hypothetical protein
MSTDVVDGELLQFRRYVSGKVQAIFCMGDTLTHLDSRDAVVILHERARSQWTLQVSSYRKLRLFPDWVVSCLDRRDCRCGGKREWAG